MAYLPDEQPPAAKTKVAVAREVTALFLIVGAVLTAVVDAFTVNTHLGVAATAVAVAGVGVALGTTTDN